MKNNHRHCYILSCGGQSWALESLEKLTCGQVFTKLFPRIEKDSTGLGIIYQVQSDHWPEPMIASTDHALKSLGKWGEKKP